MKIEKIFFVLPSVFRDIIKLRNKFSFQKRCLFIYNQNIITTDVSFLRVVTNFSSITFKFNKFGRKKVLLILYKRGRQLS